MVVKELQQGMRRASFVYPFLITQILSIAAMATEIVTASMMRADYVGVMNLGLLVQCGLFWNVIGAMCGVIMPLAGLVLMGQEVEEGNHELLLLTMLERWSVVRGKFMVLWSVSLLSVLSVLPYVVLRYLVGGMEILQELACLLTVMGLAAVTSSAAIGASSFRGVGARALVFAILMVGFLLSGMISMMACVAVTDHFMPSISSLFYHFNALCCWGCYVVFGLALARSALRLIIHAYEPHPRTGLVGMICLTPVVAGFATLFTAGFAGGIGLLGMMFAALYADSTPRARVSTKA